LIAAALIGPAAVDRCLAAPTADDRATGLEIQSLIDQAIASGASSVTIPPGTYQLASPVAGQPILSVLNAKNLTIDMTGVNLIATEPAIGMSVRWSNNLTVKGFSLDYDPLPFTQGTVINKAADNSWYDVQVDAGYDVVTGATRAIFYNNATRTPKAGTVGEYGTITPLGGQTVRVTGSPFVGNLQVNDLVSLTYNDGFSHALAVDNTTNSKFDGVKLESSPDYGVMETWSSNNTYSNLQIVPGPTPAGASQPRLLSTAFDAFHSVNANLGPTIVGSHFADQGDDGINIQGVYSLVGAVNGTTAIVSSATDQGLPFRVGDRVRGYDPKTGALGDAKVLSIQPDSSINFANIVNTFLPDHRAGPFTTGYKIVLDTPIAMTQGDLISSPDRTGSGFKVLDTTIENNWTRGIIAKGSNGLIAGNTIDGSAVAGIVVASEAMPWQEGDFSQNVIIRDNTVKNTGYAQYDPWRSQSGAISVTGPTQWLGEDHSNITIANNVVENAYGANLVVNLAKNVFVDSNQFINPSSQISTSGSQVGVDPRSVISVDRVYNVGFANNTVVNQGINGDALLRSTGNSDGLVSADMGIHVDNGQKYSVVANYRNDFQLGGPKSGWNYLWNSEGEIGNPANYTPLASSAVGYIENSASYPMPDAGHYIDLNATGGHPGQGTFDGASFDRFAIAAYTVGADGLYAIRESVLRDLDTNSSGITVFVNINGGAPVFDKDFAGGITASFDAMLGNLKSGDTIFVGIGPDTNDSYDSFNFDFSVAKFLTGDYNGDGAVTLADYLVWRSTLGTPASPFPNGTTTAPSYQAWRQLYGISQSTIVSPGLSAGAAPEPPTAVLSLLSAGLLLPVAAARKLSSGRQRLRCG
jgi:hypothetical protein